MAVHIPKSGLISRKKFVYKVFVNSNNVCTFGSNNWRADLHRSNGSSYATVVKQGRKIPHRARWSLSSKIQMDNQICTKNSENSKLNSKPACSHVVGAKTTVNTNTNYNRCLKSNQQMVAVPPHVIKKGTARHSGQVKIKYFGKEVINSTTSQQAVTENEVCMCPSVGGAVQTDTKHDTIKQIKSGSGNKVHSPVTLQKFSVMFKNVKNGKYCSPAKSVSGSSQVNRAEATVKCFNRFQPLEDCIDTDRSRSEQDLSQKGHEVDHPRKIKTSTSHLTNNQHRGSSTDVETLLHVLDDKYDLALEVRNKNKQKIAMAKSNSTFQKWNQQNVEKFGFTPLNDLLIPQIDKSIDKGTDPIELYNWAKSNQGYNFITGQYVVPSQLNFKVWANLLGDYWDKQLPYLVKYGFPLDFDHNTSLQANVRNHNSANAVPHDVRAYLQEEIELGAIQGPFKDPPLDKFHISPFMTREKPGAPHRRVIIDLSFPKGGAVNSNISKDSYLGTEFVLTLPSIDLITDKVKKFGKGSKLTLNERLGMLGLIQGTIVS